MLKKAKWILLGIAAVSIIIIAYVISLIRYAETEVTALNNYATSLSELPDVVSVQSIHRFNGLESYIVANIEHDSGQDVYFFVRDGEVQHYFFSSQLIDEMQANEIAEGLVQNGERISTQLGILNGIPIFEVQIEYEGVVRYIVINAQTREVWMDFQV